MKLYLSSKRFHQLLSWVLLIGSIAYVLLVIAKEPLRAKDKNYVCIIGADETEIENKRNRFIDYQGQFEAAFNGFGLTMPMAEWFACVELPLLSEVDEESQESIQSIIAEFRVVKKYLIKDHNVIPFSIQRFNSFILSWLNEKDVKIQKMKFFPVVGEGIYGVMQVQVKLLQIELQEELLQDMIWETLPIGMVQDYELRWESVSGQQSLAIGLTIELRDFPS